MKENQRIAINSVILYVRLIVTTLVGLYTSRIVLLQLGASDFGLFTVVGGIISMLNFFGATIMGATFRFIAIEIGKGKSGNPNKAFNISLSLYIIITLLLFILSESVGVFYIKNYLNITISKIPDAIFILQFSLLSMLFTIISTPYFAIITAYEKFSIRALIEVCRALFKLVLVYSLFLINEDKLRYFSIVVALTSLLPAILQYLYCKIKHASIIKLKFYKDIHYYKKMLVFSIWVVVGTVANLGTRQGIALILNLFFGTIINASFGIANQAYNYIQMSVKNLNQASIPQIIKKYGNNKKDESLLLSYTISKYTFFLMMIISFPVILYVDEILKIWLKDVPNFTQHFVVLMLLNGLIQTSASGFDALIEATGEIKESQLAYSIVSICVLPVSYFCYYIGYPPYAVYIVIIIATIVNLIIQISIMISIVNFNLMDYYKKTISPILKVVLFNSIQIFIRKIIGGSFKEIISFFIISMLMSMAFVYLLGISKDEKKFIKNSLKKLKRIRAII